MKLRLRQLLISLLLLPMVLTSVSFLAAHRASAVTGADWKPGRIIDDAVFFNKDAMNVTQIQAFLNAKVPVCAKNHSNYSPTYPGPYTCLKDYQENTTTGESNVGRYNPDGSPYQVPGGKTAAQIIWDAAQAYTINPQTLIVMLQKEQSLVTDDWPLILQYQRAMGQSCPDTAPCDPAFAGFYNQVSGAAWQIRHYINNPAWFNYRAGVTRYVLYNPNTTCGGTNVYIENNATAALYNYTPYQPNAGALSNLYGTATCGAYGNRNFWRLFNDWFGSTLAPDYSWQLTSQYAFTDETKTVARGLNNLAPGERVYIGFTVRNNGNIAWSNTGPNPIRVGTLRNQDRNSIFFDSSWISQSRSTVMKEASVAPGQTATFEFWVQAPAGQTSNFKEYFGLLSEGLAWMPDIGMYYSITVQPAIYTWQPMSQYAFTDQTKTSSRGLVGLEAGERVYVGITAKNTGNVTWKNTGSNPINLGISRPYDRHSVYFDNTWLGPSRPARMIESSVSPGQTATFEFWMNVPSNAYGTVYDYFNLLSEGRAWMNDPGLNFYTTIKTPSFSWQPSGQYAYTDDTKTTPIGLHNLSPGQIVFIGFSAKNTSNLTWKNTGPYPVRAGTSRTLDRNSAFCHISWINCSRPSLMKEASVIPGQTATFEFYYQAPSTPGTYYEYFNVLSEGYGWMADPGLNFMSIVR